MFGNGDFKVYVLFGIFSTSKELCKACLFIMRCFEIDFFTISLATFYMVLTVEKATFGNVSHLLFAEWTFGFTNCFTYVKSTKALLYPYLFLVCYTCAVRTGAFQVEASTKDAPCWSATRKNPTFSVSEAREIKETISFH